LQVCFSALFGGRGTGGCGGGDGGSGGCGGVDKAVGTWGGGGTGLLGGQEMKRGAPHGHEPMAM
jgi:hypothetical protein